MKALDLFAGTGWGVACHWLGIEEYGVEIMPEAVATREANGMETIFRDVWDGLLRPEQIPAVQKAMADGFTFADIYELLIASPPCQTFSMAGKGAGRQALDEVIQAITDHLYKDPAQLIEFGETHDPRTALVLAPLAYIWRDKPRYVVLEQVPTVQPVWEAYAEVMRGWGYTVETAVLNAEQYGVPQTRRRSILIANLDGPISLPVPTHSKYYSRDPKRLDPGVLPWVSMAQALGWGAKDQPSHTITAGSVEHGPTDRWASGGSTVRRRLDAKINGPEWVTREGEGVEQDPRSTHPDRFEVEDVAAIQTFPRILQSGNQANATKRTQDAPAPTICFGKNMSRIEWVTPEQAENTESSGDRLTEGQAATLQSYPQYLRSNYSATEVPGQPRERAERPTDQPAATVTSKADRAKWDGQTKMSAEEAATLQSYPETLGRGLANRPSPTITGGGVETGGAEPIAKLARYTESADWQGSTDRLTPEEAATLQSYPGAWGFTDRPAVTVGNAVGRGLIGGSGAKDAVVRAMECGVFIPSIHAVDDSYAEQTRITPEEAATLQSYPSVVYRNGNQANAATRSPDQPAPTVHFGQRSNKVEWIQEELAMDPKASGTRVTQDEAATPQSYPRDFEQRPTHLAPAGTSSQMVDPRPVTSPAHTITGSQTAEWGERPTRAAGPNDRDPQAQRMQVEEAATLQSYPEDMRPDWPFVRPSTTIMGDPRIATAGHHDHQMQGAYKSTVEESAALQTYPPRPFVWCGTKSKVFLQIGNAVPPVLAAAVLGSVLDAEASRNV